MLYLVYVLHDKPLPDTLPRQLLTYTVDASDFFEAMYCVSSTIVSQTDAGDLPGELCHYVFAGCARLSITEGGEPYLLTTVHGDPMRYEHMPLGERENGIEFLERYEAEEDGTTQTATMDKFLKF